jgi:catechol 2,3-dioxygenase-like lactoylglutathione lyase family enzyme
MKLTLHEIEFGTANPSASKAFYNSILNLDTVVDQDNLKVFNAGIDFNTSTHLPPKVVMISFLTDDLQAVIERLTVNGISFDGPKPSHLGMTTIEFKDPDGYLVRVNQEDAANKR